jgi:hypothetical protein
MSSRQKTGCTGDKMLEVDDDERMRVFYDKVMLNDIDARTN